MRLNNVTSIDIECGYIKNEKESFINLTPNSKHLILSSLIC
jgi:hypothetical protein